MSGCLDDLFMSFVKSFIFCLLLFGVRVHAESYRVVGMNDGDTVYLLSDDKKQLSIRLNAVDCPEKGQSNGKAAKKFLSDLIYKKTVEVEPVTKDRYGRTVATIWLGEMDVGLEMVKSGYAWVFEKYANRRLYPEYYAAEAEARKNRLGLWSEPNPIPPWEWRHPKALALSAADSAACDKKRYCSQMSSCDEAKYYFSVCGLHSLDKDGDGRPCNKVCR